MGRLNARYLYALGDYDEGSPTFYDTRVSITPRNDQVCLQWRSGAEGEFAHMMFLPRAELARIVRAWT